MKKEVKVAAVQMDVKGMQPESNLTRMCELIENIMAEGAIDLIVFPELANSGYVKGLEDSNFAKEYVRLAEKIPGHFTETLGKQAKKKGVYIVTGMLEAHPAVSATTYNSAVLIGPSGKVIGVHHKMHIPREERHYFYPGNTADVYATELGNISIMVCADAAFPELSRVFALKGAEIICCCYNVAITPGRECRLERIYHAAACRAFENMIFYVGCNNVGSSAGYSFMGRSAITGPMGEFLARSENDREEILRATLSEEMLVDARTYCNYFIMRQPRNYSLVSADVF